MKNRTIIWASAHSEHFCGIYGNEDGLFTPLEFNLIKLSLQTKPGQPAPFKILRGASHGLYIDQQKAFIEALTETCKLK